MQTGSKAATFDDVPQLLEYPAITGQAWVVLLESDRLAAAVDSALP